MGLKRERPKEVSSAIAPAAAANMGTGTDGWERGLPMEERICFKTVIGAWSA